MRSTPLPSDSPISANRAGIWNARSAAGVGGANSCARPMAHLTINPHAAWSAPQLPAGGELAHRYSVVSGQPLAHWNFYMALAYFKLAIIAAGIDFRRRMSGGADDADR